MVKSKRGKHLHLLAFVLCLLFWRTAHANHPDNDGCPDSEINGGESIQPVLSLVSNGQPVTANTIFPVGTGIWLDAISTVYGTCVIRHVDGAGNCVVTYQGERTIYSSSRFVFYITDTLNGSYSQGISLAKGPNIHVLDTRDPTTSSSRGSMGVYEGTHIVTLKSTFNSTQCAIPPGDVSTQFVIHGHDVASDKDLGCNANGIGNPCDPTTGNKYQREVDSESPVLPFIRHYNSLLRMEFGLGPGWTSNYHKRIEKYLDGTRRVRREDGRSEAFTNTSGNWIGDADSRFTLSEDASGFTLSHADGHVERYDLSGRIVQESDVTGKVTVYSYDTAKRLATVTGPFGQTLSFSYNQNGQVSVITDAAGNQFQYAYDALRNAKSVTFPDGKTRTYHYENTSKKHHLTGITDENGNRFATYSYASSSKAASTEHAGGVDKYTFVYNANSTTVTDARGTSRVYAFQKILGAGKVTSISQACAGCAASSTYDANGSLASRKDFNGNLTCYTNDFSRNLEIWRVEGLSGTSCPGTSGNATRTISTQWHPTRRLPTAIAEPKRIITYTYDSNGNWVFSE